MKPVCRLLSGALIALIAVLGTVTGAKAECMITGDITADLVAHELGMYRYTLEVAWDTGSPYALSHFNVLIDPPGGACACGDVASALAWESPAGTSVSPPDICTVDFDAFIECDGDPSVPGDEGIILKFEPREDDCEPGASGSGTFVFYSDYAPAPVNEEGMFLLDKHAGFACPGLLTGVFPGLPCDPVSARATSWSGIKQTFRD
ncbi:MAG: hypothetical protein R6X25_15925 [Candidatus Krumholzibacteriia bacterium]